MSVSREELVERFRYMSDDELVRRLRSGGMTEMASAVARDELAQREIESPPLRVDEDAPQAPALKTAEDDAPVAVLTVCRLFEPERVGVIVALLESEGIPVFVPEANVARMTLSALAGGIRVQVPASKYDEACAILNDFSTGALQATDEAEGADYRETPWCRTARTVVSVLLWGSIVCYALLARVSSGGHRF